MLENLNDLNLTTEEKKLIIKLNENISLLQNKTKDYFKGENTVDINTKSAFVLTYDDNLNTQEFKNIISEIDDAIKILDTKSSVDIKVQEEKFPTLLKKENIMLIRNTLNEYNTFYLKTLKQEALNILTKLQHEKNKEKIKELNEKYDEILFSIREKIINKKIIHFESIKNDYEYLSSLKGKRVPKYKVSTYWKITLVFLLVIIFISFLVSIWIF